MHVVTKNMMKKRHKSGINVRFVIFYRSNSPRCAKSARVIEKHPIVLPNVAAKVIKKLGFK